MKCGAHVSLAAYLGFTAVLGAITAQPLLVLTHLLAMGGVLGLRRWPDRLLPAMLPLAVLPFIYTETGDFSEILWGRTFDAEIMALENAFFGRSPALWLSELWPSYALSEALHLSYMLFWLLPPLLCLDLWWRGRMDDVHAVVFTIINTFLCCYLCFMLLPVDGPRGLFPPIDAALQGPMYRLSHAIMESAAASHAAFPSGHVTVSVVTAACAWRWNRPLFPFVAVVAGGITLATVYGRFHYALDAIVALPFAWRLWRGVGAGAAMSGDRPHA